MRQKICSSNYQILFRYIYFLKYNQYNSHISLLKVSKKKKKKKIKDQKTNHMRNNNNKEQFTLKQHRFCYMQIFFDKFQNHHTSINYKLHFTHTYNTFQLNPFIHTYIHINKYITYIYILYLIIFLINFLINFNLFYCKNIH